MKGLGDLVAKGAKALGITECGGCSRRRATLNRWVPFGAQGLVAPVQHDSPRIRPISGGAAAQWYVRESCTNNGNGTSSSCAASPGGTGAWKLFSQIVWGSIVAGDTLNLVTGETYTQPLTIGSSGIAGSPITITVSGGGTATIDVAGVAGLVGINFNGQSYVTVDGVIGNRVAGQSTYGLRIINNASSAGTNGYCVYENNGGANNKTMHVECSGSTTVALDDNGGGMYLAMRYAEIAYNWIHSTTAPTRWLGTGITSWSSTGSTAFNDNLVHHNWVQDMQNDGIRCGANCSLYNNHVQNIAGSGHSDSLLIQSGGYSAVYNNVVRDSGDQNIYLDNLYDSICAHIRVYNNVIDSDPGFGVVIDPEGGAGAGIVASTCTTGSAAAWDDVVIVNNTFAKTSAAQIRKGRDKAVTNVVIKNNIFGRHSNPGSYTNLDLRNTIDLTLLDANAWDYDVFDESAVAALSNYGGVNRTLAQLQALSPAREFHGKLGTPAYVDSAGRDYHLAASDTVAKNAGVNLTSPYSFLATDKDGLPRPSSGVWDVGAYQAPVAVAARGRITQVQRRSAT